MPLQDGTGPQGKGPMTGRKMGDCDTTKKSPTKKRNRRPRDGRGAGNGYGWGAPNFKSGDGDG